MLPADPVFACSARRATGASVNRGTTQAAPRWPRPRWAGVARRVLVTVPLAILVGCAPPVTSTTFRDPNMDFGALQTVAVTPFENLSRDNRAADRVRDVFINRLLSTGVLYVVPVGEVARAVARAELPLPATPSPEEIVKLGGILKAQAVVTGVVREYGEVRSGPSSANVIALSVQMLETQTGRIVWTAASTKGGISVLDRMLGGGGQPMNDVTRDAVNDLIQKLFR